MRLLRRPILSGGFELRKVLLLAVLVTLLCGCAAEETFETVTDELAQTKIVPPAGIAVDLPDNAVAPVLNGDSEQVYLCEDYQLILETVPAGDLNATIERISGYAKEDLTILKTRQGGATRYEFVWASAGEQGDCLGRGVVLDDGCYHYCMSVLRDASTTETSQISWRDVFQSFRLA